MSETKHHVALSVPECGGATMDTPRPNVPNNQPKFISDTSLHRVAKHLRLMGVDCVCYPEFSQHPDKLFEKARAEDRIILTTSTHILALIRDENDIAMAVKKRKEEICQETTKDTLVYTFKYFFLKGHDMPDRLRHICRHFNIVHNPDAVVTRCLKCNSLLQEATSEQVKDKIDGSVAAFYKRFWVCLNTTCGEVSWGIEEQVKTALNELETKNYVNMPPPTAPKPTCTFPIERSNYWKIFLYLPLPDLYNVLLCSQLFKRFALDNVHWKVRFEKSMGQLSYKEIVESYSGRPSLLSPFGKMLWVNPEDHHDPDPSGYWMGQYKKRYIDTTA
eukprot:TRINITY_DN115411_c0_g1_i1.p1 TRINITY_DN115411_c0_g1~~TRINITY_DN115411_c0_g1_i1.p1  ORF type:complete len:332 (+),score=42.33 TRINITY_DN115411_c0_g1_i1:54-1049(+)